MPETNDGNFFARVALPSGAAAQLIVDPAGFVPLGADNVQPAGRDDLIVQLLPLAAHLHSRNDRVSADERERLIALIEQAALTEQVALTKQAHEEGR